MLYLSGSGEWVVINEKPSCRLKVNQYMLTDQMSVFFMQLCQPPLSFVSADIFHTFAAHVSKTVSTTLKFWLCHTTAHFIEQNSFANKCHPSIETNEIFLCLLQWDLLSPQVAHKAHILSFPSWVEFYLHLLCHKWTLSDFKIKGPKWTPCVSILKNKMQCFKMRIVKKSGLVHLIIIELTASIGFIWSWQGQGPKKSDFFIHRRAHCPGILFYPSYCFLPCEHSHYPHVN